jgi:hypothetical protein
MIMILMTIMFACGTVFGAALAQDGIKFSTVALGAIVVVVVIIGLMITSAVRAGKWRD